jgi:hypothetical protein
MRLPSADFEGMKRTTFYCAGVLPNASDAIRAKALLQRRARYLLPPMPVYRALISDIYHLPAE